MREAKDTSGNPNDDEPGYELRAAWSKQHGEPELMTDSNAPVEPPAVKRGPYELIRDIGNH